MGVIGDGNYICRVHTDSVARDDEAKKTEDDASPLTPLPLELQVILTYVSEDFNESL